jgi:hypothetical protein
MNFKEIFDKQIIVEEHVRKGLKIFYEIDLNLIKPKQEENLQNITTQQQTQAPVQQVQPTPQIDNTQTQQPDSTTQTTEIPPEQQVQQPEQDNKPDISGLLSSVKTEEAAEDSEEKVMRHFKGEYVCKTEQSDNIQTFDDLISILGDIKKDGTNIIDDFCKEIIILCANQNYNEIKTKLDKKSKIFVEVYFGYKKDDSVGVRFKKSENSDSLSSSILIDNQIATLTKFNIERVHQKIVEYRNYEANKS